MASAILALVFPEKYAVIDFRGCRQVFGESKETVSISDYKRYLREIQKLADELRWPVQEVDRRFGSMIVPVGENPLQTERWVNPRIKLTRFARASRSLGGRLMRQPLDGVEEAGWLFRISKA